MPQQLPHECIAHPPARRKQSKPTPTSAWHIALHHPAGMCGCMHEGVHGQMHARKRLGWQSGARRQRGTAWHSTAHSAPADQQLVLGFPELQARRARRQAQLPLNDKKQHCTAAGVAERPARQVCKGTAQHAQRRTHLCTNGREKQALCAGAVVYSQLEGSQLCCITASAALVVAVAAAAVDGRCAVCCLASTRSMAVVVVGAAAPADRLTTVKVERYIAQRNLVAAPGAEQVTQSRHSRVDQLACQAIQGAAGSGSSRVHCTGALHCMPACMHASAPQHAREQQHTPIQSPFSKGGTGLDSWLFQQIRHQVAHSPLGFVGSRAPAAQARLASECRLLATSCRHPPPLPVAAAAVGSQRSPACRECICKCKRSVGALQPKMCPHMLNLRAARRNTADSTMDHS